MYHWKTNALPASWLTLSWRGDMPVPDSLLWNKQQKFVMTENLPWWCVCEYGAGVADSLEKRMWSFCGMQHPLLTLLWMSGYWWHCCLRNTVLTELLLLTLTVLIMNWFCLFTIFLQCECSVWIAQSLDRKCKVLERHWSERENGSSLYVKHLDRCFVWSTVRYRWILVFLKWDLLLKDRVHEWFEIRFGDWILSMQ